MADRRFEIQDQLVKPGLLLNVPPLLEKGVSLAEDEVPKMQSIARLRIHVELAIGQAKSRFYIFDGTIPLNTASSINQIWTVACLLANFLGLLIDN